MQFPPSQSRYFVLYSLSTYRVCVFFCILHFGSLLFGKSKYMTSSSSMHVHLMQVLVSFKGRIQATDREGIYSLIIFYESSRTDCYYDSTKGIQMPLTNFHI